VDPKSTIAASAQHEPPENESAEDPVYEFRLFRSAPSQEAGKSNSSTSLPSAKIKLVRSPSPSHQLEREGDITKPRPQSFYFTKPTPSDIQAFNNIAITTETLTLLSRTPWPGATLPWRVTILPRSQVARSCLQPPSQSLPPSSALTRASKPKPNKQRRIALRQRLTTRRAHHPQPQPQPPKPPSTTTNTNTNPANPSPTAKTKTKTTIPPPKPLDLAPEERAARNARNREKKLKRRQREREKKAASAAGPSPQSAPMPPPAPAVDD
jgi:hypothetical protein